MKKRRIYTIYALVFGNTAYIGKTTSTRLSWVHRRHQRGEIKRTKMFSTKGIKPTLHILERDEMELFEAYWWIVCYVFIFREAGYEILLLKSICLKKVDSGGEPASFLNL